MAQGRSLIVTALALLVGCVLMRPLPAQSPGAGVHVERVGHQGGLYDVVRIDLDRARLRLYWKDERDRRYRTFENLEAALRDRGHRVLFAANAGIFHTDYTPLGLHVEEGMVLAPLNRDSGEGNFFLEPNGVFHIDEAGAAVTATDAFAAAPERLVLATQSGPLLLRHGEVHPAFAPDSRHRNIRSGVGVKTPKEAVFVLSVTRVTFHQMALFFRDRLGIPDALYLDGGISAFHLPGQPTLTPQEDFVGILAVTAPLDENGYNARPDPSKETEEPD